MELYGSKVCAQGRTADLVLMSRHSTKGLNQISWVKSMRRFQRVCVFCGSQVGLRAEYREAAREFGWLLAQRGCTLVYGGGSIGLMGVLADAVLEQQGDVIGVIPAPLATKELAHPRVARMEVVRTMHQRKARMAELSDAFVGLPGGFGTLEELFEVISWAQLGIHRKPIGLLDTLDFYQPLIAMVDRAVQEGFLHRQLRQLLLVDDTPEHLLDRLAAHELPPVPRWIEPDET